MTYIAYKFTNSPDLNKLKDNLSKIAQVLESNGEPTFILLRDKKEWGVKHKTKFHSIFYMIFKLLQSKQVVAYVDHSNSSPGLKFELTWAKILGKPINLIITKDLAAPEIRNKADNLIEINSTKDLARLTFVPTARPHLALSKSIK